MYKKSQTKRVVGTLTIWIFIVLTGFYLFNLYINIDIKEEKNTYNTIRTTQDTSELKQENKQISEIIEEVSTTVVGISKLKNNGTSIFLENSAEKLGLGTGIIVSEDGYILTNWHVAGDKYSQCYITLESGEEYTGNVLWANQDIDLAILKINTKGLQYAKLGNSNQVKVGENVYAIGNPIGHDFLRTVTKGIISAVNRTIKIEEEENISYMEDLIQTDAGINPGNSGGPLINVDGEVIGINSVKIASAEGIGFAIPINIVKPIIEKFINTGKFEEASIGIFAYDKEAVKYLDSNLKLNSGIYVVEVIKNSSAEKSGIKEKDIILKIDENEINTMGQLRQYIYMKNPKDKISLLIQRNGIQSVVDITLEKR